jgi:predicted dehydrogenase
MPMASQKLRVGFVGTGGIAQSAHIPGWQQLGGTEIVALCDVSEAAMLKTAELTGVPKKNLFSDYNEMLAKVELDVVDVCTPNALHKGPTVAALDAGCHVIVEKPVAISAAEVEEMIAARNRSKKLLMVAQSVRFTPEAIAARRFVEAGGMGWIYWAQADLLRPRGVPAWGTFIDRNMSAGGPCYDLAVHILDLCLHLMDFPEPISVSANVWVEISDKPSIMRHDPKKFTVPDELAAGFIRFKDGACISLQTSWAVNAPEGTFNCLLAGTKAGIRYRPFTIVREEYGMLTSATPQVLPESGIKSHHEEIRRFVEAIRTGTPSPVPPEQALITQRILDGIYSSADKGREVKV